SGRFFAAHVDGHDDGAAHHAGLAHQAASLRARRRLEPGHRIAFAEFPMTVDGALELLRNAMISAATISGPVLLRALLVGSGLGVLQTVVQVNEASLSFVIKLLAVCVCIAVLGPRLLTKSVDYTRTTIGRIAEVVR